MAEIEFAPGTATSTAVAQVDTFTPANVGIGDVFTLTATADNGDTAAVNFTASAATAANVAAGLVAAWNASTHRLHTGITASGTSTVVLTADTAGVPFSVAGSTTDGNAANTQTLTRVATTANVGQSDAALAANYYGNALAVNSDNLTIGGRNVAAVAYGKNQSAVTVTSLKIQLSNAYNVGLAPSSTNPTAEYFRVGATTTKIGEPPGDGSSPTGASFIAHDGGNVQGTWYVYNSNQTGVNGLACVHIKGTHASNVAHVLGGSVAIAGLNPGETATFATVNQGGGKLLIGGGVTLTTLAQDGGTCELQCAATTVTQDGGDLKTTGAGAVTTMKIGGSADLQSSGTITTLEVLGTGRVTFANSDAARTVTTIKLHKGAQLNIACSNLTITNAIQYVNCRADECPTTTNKHVTAVYAAGA